jgi:hypothetical protein
LKLQLAKGRHVSPALLDRTRLRARITTVPSVYAFNEVLECLKAAHQTRKTLQKDHKTLEANYLTNLAKALVLKCNSNMDDPKFSDQLTARTQKEVKRLTWKEKKQPLYKTIAYQLSNLSTQPIGLTRVDIPVSSTEDPHPDPKTW